MEPKPTAEHAAVAENAARMLDVWPVLLDAMDGLVAQTIARGYSVDQARALVIAVVLNGGK